MIIQAAAIAGLSVLQALYYTGKEIVAWYKDETTDTMTRFRKNMANNVTAIKTRMDKFKEKHKKMKERFYEMQDLLLTSTNNNNNSNSHNFILSEDNNNFDTRSQRVRQSKKKKEVRISIKNE